MKLSDYVADFLAKQGIEHVFGLTGGAVVHLFDSVARHKKIQPVFHHHEQAAAFAAQAYARVTNNLGACFVTTGPGGTNALTGLCAAWLDSIPSIYISGQARLAHTTKGKPIRQLGTQQLDIVPIVSHMTKYAVMIDDAKLIRYYLEKAVYLAKTPRPGPVWLDIPLDMQWASIEPETLKSFDPSELAENSTDQQLKEKVSQCCTMIANAKRPLILAGYGIRLAGAEKEFRVLVEKFHIPFVTSWNASDMVDNDNSFYAGRPGMFGQRGANLAVQNCDCLISIGSHLCIPLTGTMFPAFARDAKIIMVDTDKSELEHRTVRVDLPIHCDAKIFLREILGQLSSVRLPDIRAWQEHCSRYKAKYNAVPQAWAKEKKYVNPYVFVDRLSNELDKRDVVVVDGGGTINQIAFQAFRVKVGQRLMISAGLCAMGSGLPESVGACFGHGGKRTICLCGDGSMQLNIQELQTIFHHKLPVKIFFINNSGYLSIRHTQAGFLESNFAGSNQKGGLSLPDFLKVAKAYGIKTNRIKNHVELKKRIKEVLKTPGPVVCEVLVSPKQEVSPRQGFEKMPDGTFRARPFEDMYPFLGRKEFQENMLVKPWQG